MFKFMILFHQPDDIMAFEPIYNQLLAMIETMPDVTRRQVNSVSGSPTGKSPYYRILEVYYENQQTMNNSLNSDAGQEAGSQLNALPDGSFEMIFAEVYEEAGGFTPEE